MKNLDKLLFACVPLLGLAACSGGDTEDRLDVADPTVRFVDVAPLAAPVTLYRGDTPLPEATNVGYPFASDYVDVSTSNATWTLKTANGATPLGTVALDPARGNKYTLVALPGVGTDVSLVSIADPYNKSLSSEEARLRVLNASAATPSVDVYLAAPGTDITPGAITPTISNIAYRSVGPASGNDAVEIAPGTYRMVVTLAGTKTVVKSGQLNLPRNKDVLLITLPATPPAAGVRTLVKVEGTPGLVELPAG